MIMANFTSKQYWKLGLLGCWALMAGILMGNVHRASAQDGIIPADLKIQKTYRPGTGQSVGTVRRVQGKAVVQHEKETHGYRVYQKMNLYSGDVLYTAGDGHLELILNDGSSLTLSSDTHMVIDKSVYNPRSRHRHSFFSMLAGKARFIVKKLSDYKYSQFNVRTEASVVGVRGSDFIIEVSQQGNKTVITALGNTVLEIIDPAHPLQEPVIVTSFQQLIAVLGEVLGNPEDVPQEEIRQKLEELGLIPSDGGGTGGPSGPAGPGGGYVPHGGSPESPGGFPGPSLPFLSSGGPTRPLPPPIDDPGPDDTNNDDPADEIKPPAPFPRLPDMPAHP